MVVEESSRGGGVAEVKEKKLFRFAKSKANIHTLYMKVKSGLSVSIPYTKYNLTSTTPR